jgi:hypothetical protein
VNFYLGHGEFGVRAGEYDDFQDSGAAWRKEEIVNIPDQLLII